MNPFYANSDAPCAMMAYRHQNQTDRNIPVPSEVSGKVIDDKGVSVPDVCLGLFRETDDKLLESTRMKQNPLSRFPASNMASIGWTQNMVA